MKWVKSLLILETERIEKRLGIILEYIFNTYPVDYCLLPDIDATGKFGSQLTERINNNEKVKLSKDELLSVVNEDGQIFELNIVINSMPIFQIIVVRGSDVDILGIANLPQDVLGDHSEGNLANYLIGPNDHGQ